MTTPTNPPAPLSAYLPPQPRFGACPACGAWCLLGPGETLRTPLLGLPHGCTPPGVSGAADADTAHGA